jgi:hypothetical protein
MIDHAELIAYLDAKITALDDLLIKHQGDEHYPLVQIIVARLAVKGIRADIEAVNGTKQ